MSPLPTAKTAKRPPRCFLQFLQCTGEVHLSSDGPARDPIADSCALNRDTEAACAFGVKRAWRHSADLEAAPPTLRILA